MPIAQESSNASNLIVSILKGLEDISNWLWGFPLLYLLIGGGLYFTIYSRFVPFFYLRHSIQILRGKYNNANDPGEINHFQALCSALSGTVGMGNITGVAVAIVQGGPGALFWMWICALLGMATKFFTCSLAVMYRGTDQTGQVQGGPMYFITEGLGKKWKPLAMAFCFFGLFGCLPMFQSNQLTAIVSEMFFKPNDWFVDSSQNVTLTGQGLFGLLLAIFVGVVILGGIQRIGKVAATLVPFMVILYGGCALIIIIMHASQIPEAFRLIITDAFTGQAVTGGVLGSVISIGVRRAAFSNEAGMGTEAMAHGAAKTKEPIREGLVAMLGPMIDTLIVCTITGLVIINTGVWEKGVTINRISKLNNAIEQYVIEKNISSVITNDLIESIITNKEFNNKKFYVSPVNKIDAWGKRIEIKNDINSSDYKLILFSSGPDKTLNTPDDLTNEISPNSYSGVMLTEKAYRMISSSLGPYLLLICVLCFSFSSMIGFSYYVTKCGMFLFGIKARIPLIIFYLIGIIISAIVDLKYLIYFLDIMFGLMAVPTIISTIILSPRVMKEAREYFITLKGV
ncbi:MAG: alanine:cation symporter family protein [Limisphaerales bacterium]|nr:MAG: alanine:cation symporter family protein [Limisphaerales bacterium]